MFISLDCSELSLKNGQLLRLSQAAGVTIRCLAGTIWITSPGEIEDIFLDTGMHHVIRSPGLVLIESVGDGRVCLESPGPGHEANRWSGLLIRLMKRAWQALRRKPGISRTGRAASATGFPA